MASSGQMDVTLMVVDVFVSQLHLQMQMGHVIRKTATCTTCTDSFKKVTYYYVPLFYFSKTAKQVITRELLS